jgi:hypothetical protein
VNLRDVRVLKTPLVRATPKQVDALEAALWVTFPAGYREYVTTLGEGTLGGAFVRVYPPWRIERELSEWRRRVGKYWFWDRGRKLLPKERGVECVAVGDTANGDELVFHPTRPGRLFVLPRDSETVFDAGPDLLAAVEWVCSSGKLTPKFAERDFEPFDSRKEPRTATAPADPPGEALDDVVATAAAWAKRHDTRKRAIADVKKVAGMGEKVARLYEAVVIDGEYPTSAGYLAVYRVTDPATGLETGRVLWTDTGDSWGTAYEPNEANRARLKRKKK